MSNRNALLLVAGAAIFALDASASQAQDSTRARSSTRIPISKEAPGEVAPPRVDTVTVYRTDTLPPVVRVDTVTTTNTVTRTDTVVQTVNLTPRKIGGVYFGLGAGADLPFGSIRTVNEPGWVGQLNLGWQSMNMPLGVRLDGNFTQFADNADYATLGPRAQMWNGNADARLNLPFFNHTLGNSVLFTPYVIGGGSYVRYNNLRMKLDHDGGVAGGYGPQGAVIAGNTDNATSGPTIMDESWHDKWGWNAGGGLAFHSGKKEMFAEARWVHFNHDDARFGSAWAIPIVFGVNFF